MFAKACSVSGGPRLVPTAALTVGAEMLGTAMKACIA